MSLDITQHAANEILLMVAQSSLDRGLDGVSTAKEVLNTLAVLENGGNYNATQAALAALQVPYEKLKLIERISQQFQQSETCFACQKCTPDFPVKQA